MECPFCSHVFHNTTERIGADIASPERVAGTGGALGVLGVEHMATERALQSPAIS